jgi:hypothetical protein
MRLLAASALVTLALALGLAPVAAAAPSTLVTVDNRELGRPVPSGFLGLSLEYLTLPKYTGRTVDPVLVQLIANLTPGQRPVLRIGGDSTDWTWWPVPGMTQPAGIRFTLSNGWIAAMRALAQATNARLILGINLEAGSTPLAVTEANALLDGLGRRRVEALEIGNEPELYPWLPWYTGPNGFVYGRPHSYNFRAFTDEFTRIGKALGDVPLAGPSTGQRNWISYLPQFLAAEPDLALVTAHRYGLNACVTNRGGKLFPTVPHLLSAFASRTVMSGMQPSIAVARAHGVPFRVDEMGSVTCRGTRGVSDTFASALWSLDSLFSMAKEGVEGVNLHTSDKTENRFFDFQETRGQWSAAVRPDYYGMLMFAQAAPPGSHLLRTTPTSKTAQTRWWATLARDGTLRVVLINDSLTEPTSVRVEIPVKARTGVLERLRAPSAYATSGVTLAGQSFGRETTTGLLAGRLKTSRVRIVRHAFIVRMPAASAAMVTVAAPGAA